MKDKINYTDAGSQLAKLDRITRLLCYGICILMLAAAHGIGATVVAQRIMPEKLGVSAQAQLNAGGATAEITVFLLDGMNNRVPTPKDVQVNLDTRLASGQQKTQLVIKAKENCAHCSVPLQEGGLIEFSATQLQSKLRPGSAFVRIKPFIRKEGAVSSFSPYPHDTQSGSGPNTHFGNEVAKVGGTVNSVSDTVQSVKGAAESIAGIFGHSKGEAGILVGSQDHVYLADGLDGAVVQIFLGRPVKKRTDLMLSASGGKLNPDRIVIEADHDSGQAILTSENTGSVTVSVTPASLKIAGAPTNSLVFQFGPPIARVVLTASPPRISLFETAEIKVQYQDKKGTSMVSDIERESSLSIINGRGVLEPSTLIVQANKQAQSAKFTPTRSGKSSLQVSVPGLPGASCDVEVTLPTLLMGLTGFGGALGGLLAAFQKGLPTAVRQGPIRRRFKALPWWRMAIGLVTGFVLYWAIVFLSISMLPKALALNPATALVCALLGGWLGLSVFEVVLKALRITQASKAQHGSLAEARG